MKILAISDTHGILPQQEFIPECDILIHAGDLCPNRSYNDKSWDSSFQYNWLKDTFIPWKESIKCKYFLFTPGNHDTVFEYPLYKKQVKTLLEKSGVSVLIDEAIVVDGIKFYGTPWVSPVGNWSFLSKGRSMEILRNIIPDDTNILISHSPPYGVLDEIEHYGCKYLLERIKELDKLEYLICGHCHEEPGIIKNYFGIDSCDIINCATIGVEIDYVRNDVRQII